MADLATLLALIWLLASCSITTSTTLVRCKNKWTEKLQT